MATNADKMTKLDMKKDFDKLSEADKHYMKRLEALNMERVTKLKNLRYRNKITGLSIGGAVIGVYLYTLYAVRQERFLEDFDKLPPAEK